MFCRNSFASHLSAQNSQTYILPLGHVRVSYNFIRPGVYKSSRELKQLTNLLFHLDARTLNAWEI